MSKCADCGVNEASENEELCEECWLDNSGNVDVVCGHDFYRKTTDSMWTCSTCGKQVPVTDIPKNGFARLSEGCPWKFYPSGSANALCRGQYINEFSTEVCCKANCAVFHMVNKIVRDE